MKTIMATTTRRMLTGAAVLALTAAFAPAAWAGCGDNVVKLKQHTSWTSDSLDNPLLMQVNDIERPSIVGMWSVTLTAGGSQFDWGYQVWHADGTEIMNSGSRAPATENFCLDVWARSGPFSYKLNHFALSYDPSGTLNAKVNIKEDVVVDPKASSFSGPFTADVYSPTGSLLQHIAGRIIGQRVTVN